MYEQSAIDVIDNFKEKLLMLHPLCFKADLSQRNEKLRCTGIFKYARKPQTYV